MTRIRSHAIARPSGGVPPVFHQPAHEWSSLEIVNSRSDLSQHSVAVEDLLARHVDVQWYEGVAVVQGVCRQLLA